MIFIIRCIPIISLSSRCFLLGRTLIFDMLPQCVDIVCVIADFGFIDFIVEYQAVEKGVESFAVCRHKSKELRVLGFELHHHLLREYVLYNYRLIIICCALIMSRYGK